MALPSDANIDLLLCDDVRGTPDGKLDIAGYFPVPAVKLDGSAPLPAAVNLTFVFVVKDGEGSFRGMFRILDPLGQELHQVEIAEFKKTTTQPHLIMLQVNRIPVVRSGDFTIVLELDGHAYRRPVRMYQ